MIDFIKLSLQSYLAPNLLQNKLLSFTHEVSNETGEVLCSKASYKNLKFTLYKSGYTELKGSLHYYSNQGKQNHNNFNYSNLKMVLQDLENKFEIKEGIIKNLEVGVNLSLSFSPSNILDGLLFHIGKPLYQPIDKPYKECSHQRLYIKCYDKGKQFKLDKNILRFELKYIKMEDLNQLGIKYLSDLKDKNKLEKLKHVLLRYWMEILFYDYTLDLNQITNKVQNKLLQYQNILFWKNLTPQQRKYHKQKLKTLTGLYSKHLQQEIYSRIDTTYNILLNN